APPHGRARADALRDRPRRDRAADDPAPALCDGVGARRSPLVLRRTRRGRGRCPAPARSDRGLVADAVDGVTGPSLPSKQAALGALRAACLEGGRSSLTLMV